MPREQDSFPQRNGCWPSGQAENAQGLPEEAFEAILAELRRDWIAGKRIRAAERLRQHPAAGCDRAQAAELIYNEFTLRQELNDSPDWGEYLRQFPEHAAALQMWHQADQLVEQVLTPEQSTICAPPGLNDYELLEKIGHGGMGVVYKARQKSLDRVVAVKMIRSGEYASEEERKRFNREARAVARLHHPNIIQIYGVDEAQGQPFLSLEFVEGQSLARRMNGTPLPGRQAASLLEVLARAMHHAHGQGIVHQDLKPSNILLAGATGTAVEQCVPKITDFGLAKRLDKRGDTGSGAVAGTPSYMAPEQAESRNSAIDRRTDVYGLGAILYEVLTGRPPFQADSPLQTFQQILEAEPARPRLLNPAVPRDLETVCLKCLEKEPGQRYATAEALAVDLRRFLLDEPIRARPVGAVERSWRWCRRKPVIASLVAALLVAVVSGLSASLVLWREAVTNLHKEEAARQQAEDNLTMIRQILDDDLQFSQGPLPGIPQAHSMRVELLLKAEAFYVHLLEKRPHDQHLRVVLSVLLRRLARSDLGHPQNTQALAFLQKAADLFATRSFDGTCQPEYLAAGLYAYKDLGQAYESEGRHDSAQQAFVTALRLCQELAKVSASPNTPHDALFVGLWLAHMVSKGDGSEAGAQKLLESLGGDPALLGGAPGDDVFLNLVRASLLSWRAAKSSESGARLALAREASAIFSRCAYHASLNQYRRLLVATYLGGLGSVLRKGGAVEEALSLSRRSIQILQELVSEAPGTPDFFVELSDAWYQSAKAHWDLDQVPETLEACRQAVAAQRQALALAPAGVSYRNGLGQRYARLGRKLCELGHLDEAEACFRQRQALWPGDATKHAEALHELRKWAAQLGDDKKILPPARQQQRQRYLDLYARLESMGASVAGD